MSRTTFPVTKDVTRKMHPIKGCKPDETDVETLAAGGVSSGIIPEAGSLVFNTDGGVSELQVDLLISETSTRSFFGD